MSASTDHTDAAAGKDPSRLSLKDILVIVLATLICALALRMFVIEVYRIPSGSMENTLLTGDMILVNKLSYGVRIPSSVPFLSIPLRPQFLIPLSNIRRGDVIVFELPGVAEIIGSTMQAAFIKRCIGLPGDTVEIRNAQILVNARELLPPGTVRAPGFEHAMYDKSMFPIGSGFTAWEYGPLRVPREGDIVTLDSSTLPLWKHLVEREGHVVDLSASGSILIDGVGRTTYTLERNYYFVLGDNLDNSTDSRMWGFVCEDDIVGEALLVYWSSAPENDYTSRTRPLRHVRWDRIGSLIR